MRATKGKGFVQYFVSLMITEWSLILCKQFRPLQGPPSGAEPNGTKLSSVVRWGHMLQQEYGHFSEAVRHRSHSSYVYFSSISVQWESFFSPDQSPHSFSSFFFLSFFFLTANFYRSELPSQSWIINHCTPKRTGMKAKKRQHPHNHVLAICQEKWSSCWHLSVFYSLLKNKRKSSQSAIQSLSWQANCPAGAMSLQEQSGT